MSVIICVHLHGHINTLCSVGSDFGILSPSTGLPEGFGTELLDLGGKLKEGFFTEADT